MHFERSHPEAPWLGKSAVLFLGSFLKTTDTGLEWGSGRSTAWFAQRVAHLSSIESNSQWFEYTCDRLAGAGLADKVTGHFIPCEWSEFDEPTEVHPYVGIAETLPDNSLDFALIDGSVRARCMEAVMPKLKPGGLLILDNANRFIPNEQGGESSTVHEARSQPRSPVWARLIEDLSDWRWILTSDGLWDTRFWIKPTSLSEARANARPATVEAGSCV